MRAEVALINQAMKSQARLLRLWRFRRSLLSPMPSTEAIACAMAFCCTLGNDSMRSNCCCSFSARQRLPAVRLAAASISLSMLMPIASASVLPLNRKGAPDSANR